MQPINDLFKDVRAKLSMVKSAHQSVTTSTNISMTKTMRLRQVCPTVIKAMLAADMDWYAETREDEHFRAWGSKRFEACKRMKNAHVTQVIVRRRQFLSKYLNSIEKQCKRLSFHHFKQLSQKMVNQYNAYMPIWRKKHDSQKTWSTVNEKRLLHTSVVLLNVVDFIASNSEATPTMIYREAVDSMLGVEMKLHNLWASNSRQYIHNEWCKVHAKGRSKQLGRVNVHQVNQNRRTFCEKYASQLMDKVNSDSIEQSKSLFSTLAQKRADYVLMITQKGIDGDHWTKTKGIDTWQNRERTETIDLTGSYTLSLGFANIDNMSVVKNTASKCDGSNFESEIQAASSKLRTFNQRFNTLKGKNVPRTIERTKQVQDGSVKVSDRCLQWVDNYDRNLGKFHCLKSDGHDQLVCDQKKLVNGKAVCQHHTTLQRVSVCKRESVNGQGVVECSQKENVWPKYVCEGEFKDSRGTTHCSSMILQLPKIFCKKYENKSGERFCSNNEVFYGQRQELIVCSSSEKVVNGKVVEKKAEQCNEYESIADDDFESILKEFKF